MVKAYLTIDDSPSAQTDELTAGLKARGVPALLFCRGDRLEKNPGPVIRAIEKGFVIGNHAWSHTRFSTLSFEDGVAEIEKTDLLIDEAYRASGAARPGKYFRFPHMDRGCGGWVVDYDAAGPHRGDLIRLFTEGLNIDLTPPDGALKEKKQKLLQWLVLNGFEAPPFRGVRHPWYAQTEMATAVDAMFTFSTADWMITPRHVGKWPYKTLEHLKDKIDSDADLWRGDTAHIILAHDQDGLAGTVLTLVDHMRAKDMIFTSAGE